MLPTSLNRLRLSKLVESSAASRLGVGGVWELFLSTCALATSFNMCSLYAHILTSNVCRLYHINPWTDTTEGVCPSFTAFREDPVSFLLTRFAGMQPVFAEFLAKRVFCILPSNDPLDVAGQRIGARELGKWIKDKLVGVMGRRKDEPALLDAGVTEMFEEAIKEQPGSIRMHTPLPLSPPQHAIPLPQQLNAVSGVLADLPSVSPSPRWRHKRGLSNASSIGYSLSSVPQSRRPVSRKTSFSVAPGEGICAPGLMTSSSSNGPFPMISRPTSAAGSRATTPLLRGRSLAASLGMNSTLSRAPSGNRELRTLFDHGIEEEEGESLGMGLGLEVNGQSTAPVKDAHSPRSHTHYHHHHHHQDSQSHRREVDLDQTAGMAEVEGDNSRSPSRSESTHSAVRRRKRGARKGKNVQLQQRLDMLEKALSEQQQLLHNTQQELNKVRQVQQPAQAPGPQVHAVTAPATKADCLADKSQRLARELSRTSRSASVSQLNPHGQRISPSSSQRGPVDASSSSLAPGAPALRRAVSDLSNSGHPDSDWEREASLNSSFTYTLPFSNGLPSSVKVSHNPGPLPRSLLHLEAEAQLQSSSGLPPTFPVLRTPSGSLSSTNVPSFTSILANSATSSSPPKAKPSSVQTSISASSVPPPAPSPTATISPAIVKKTSKWKLNFGKSNNTLSRSTLPSSSDEVLIIGSPDADVGEEQHRHETGKHLLWMIAACALTYRFYSFDNLVRTFLEVSEIEVEGACKWSPRTFARLYTIGIT